MYDIDLPCSTACIAAPPDRGRPVRGRPAGHFDLAERAGPLPGWQQIDGAEIVALSERLRAARSLR